MKIIRIILGQLILFLSWITTPRSIKRDREAQARVDQATQKLALYQFHACPFCIKVRRQMKRQSLNIQTRDAKKDLAHRDELLNGGGKLKVPCLRIEDKTGEVKWLYESSDIVSYLQNRFS